MNNIEFPKSLLNELDETVWMCMEPKERLALLQKVENFMASVTGRDACEVRVVPAEKLKGRSGVLCGYFSQADGCIYINPSYLTSKTMIPGVSIFHFGTALDTLIHEGRHAWQKYVIDHPKLIIVSKKDRLALKMNSKVYFNAQVAGYGVYGGQLNECDARRFSLRVMEQLSKQLWNQASDPGIAVKKAINQNRKEERRFAEHILAELDETSIREMEIIIRELLAKDKEELGVDYSEISVFNEAIKLIRSKDIDAFVDSQPIRITGKQKFTDKLTIEKDSSVFAKPAIKLKRENTFKVGKTRI